MQICVSNLMRSCPAVIVPDSILLRDAAERIVVDNLRLLIAVDDENKLAGIISESAVIRQLMQSSNRNEDVKQILSRHTESLRSDATLDSVLPVFRSSCNVVVPVVDAEHKVVGVMHRSDIVRHLLSANPSSTNERKPHFLDPDAKRQQQPPSESSSD